MLEDAQNAIAEMMLNSSVERITFRKSGKISVKFDNEPRAYTVKNLDQIQEIIDADKNPKP